MCMIIYKPAHKKFPDDELFNHILASNPHGTGVLTQGKVTKWNKECYPQDFEKFDTAHAVMVHSRIATRGSIKTKNIHPFTDDRLPGLWFAHNGTMSYLLNEDITDSEYFYKNVLVPMLLKHPLSDLLYTKHDMRSTGSRFILWTGRDEDVPYLRGEWFLYKGVYYSHYVPKGIPVGQYDRWWQPPTNLK